VITKFIIYIALLSLLQLIILPSFVTAESRYVEVIDIDSDGYSQVVSPGTDTFYDWTLENIDAFNRTLNVSISFKNSNPRWTAVLESDNEITLTHKGDVKPVRLRVSTPQVNDKSSTKVTLTFTVDSNGVPIHIEERITTSSLSEPDDEDYTVFGLFSNPLAEPLDKEWGVFLLTVLIWLVISIIVVIVIGPVVKSIIKKTKTEIDDLIIRIVRTPILLLIFFYGFVSSLNILDEHIPKYVIDIVENIYGFAAVILLFYVSYKLFKDILVYYSRKIAQKTATKIDDVLVPIIEKIGIMILGLVALGYLLGYLNIDLTIFVAGGVVVSMVLAFAAQETLSNFFSGIFILTDRPFNVGDTIILTDGDWYEVRYIGLRSTRLFRFKDASLVSIPNNNLANEKIANFTNPHDLGRVSKTYNVAYGSDPEKVKKIILEVISANPDIITDDEDNMPVVRFSEMADSSVNFSVLVKIRDRDKRFDVGEFLSTEIYKRFNKEGIEIPFPQQVVHLKDKKGG
jgi:small-conductance mechanosensitive channel